MGSSASYQETSIPLEDHGNQYFDAVDLSFYSISQAAFRSGCGCGDSSMCIDILDLLPEKKWNAMSRFQMIQIIKEADFFEAIKWYVGA